ncbi:MAG: nitrile hydratase subunit alpha [Neomegalonema sp.]|nr:nitrile hydratase subunit alpha [Neomegalonema sp.]
MPHDHAELSPSGHPYRQDLDAPLTRFQTMEIAVRELLIEKGVLTAEEVAAQIARMDARSPRNGAAVVARAWVDPAFKARLLADASAACREMGFEIDGLKLIAVENTDQTHNLVVCTLCSCYPRNLIGPPPDWYKERAYRTRAVRAPRPLLREFGLELAPDIRLQVHDSTADMRYIVLPQRPAGAEGWSEDQLAALVTRDSLIGVGVALEPRHVSSAKIS